MMASCHTSQCHPIPRLSGAVTSIWLGASYKWEKLEDLKLCWWLSRYSSSFRQDFCPSIEHIWIQEWIQKKSEMAHQEWDLELDSLTMRGANYVGGCWILTLPILTFLALRLGLIRWQQHGSRNTNWEASNSEVLFVWINHNWNVSLKVWDVSINTLPPSQLPSTPGTALYHIYWSSIH